jgi:hypothetical protein
MTSRSGSRPAGANARKEGTADEQQCDDERSESERRVHPKPRVQAGNERVAYEQREAVSGLWPELHHHVLAGLLGDRLVPGVEHRRRL